MLGKLLCNVFADTSPAYRAILWLMDDELVPLPEAARRVGRTRETLWVWHRQGLLPVQRLGRWISLVRMSDVEYAQSHRRPSGRPPRRTGSAARSTSGGTVTSHGNHARPPPASPEPAATPRLARLDRLRVAVMAGREFDDDSTEIIRQAREARPGVEQA